ncbi:MAG: DUF3575 domain-containing protein [Polyangiaceae bacterium]|nr:DUF3575 domain-containing protein [Polyangiaceae bacterium]
MNLKVSASSIFPILCLVCHAYAAEAAEASSATEVASVDELAPGSSPRSTSGANQSSPVADGAVESAKKASPATGAVYVNPVGLLFGLIDAEVDVTVSKNMAVVGEGSYWSFDVLGLKTTAWGLGGGVRYFFGDEMYRGWYVSPVLQVAHSTASIEDDLLGEFSASATLAGVEATVGHQWHWKPFTLRLGGGLLAFQAVAKSGDETIKTELAGVSPVLDGALGLTF